MNNEKYINSYSENKFWDKVSKLAAKAGKKLIHAGLLLYFAMQRKETPLWAKTVIAGALGYFISPFDLIPDFLVGIGHTDDLATLISAVAAVSLFIDEEVERKATTKMNEWMSPKTNTISQ